MYCKLVKLGNQKNQKTKMVLESYGVFLKNLEALNKKKIK